MSHERININGHEVKAFTTEQVQFPEFQELAELPRWVVWQLEGGRKVPYSPQFEAMAKVDNPSTWGTLAQARRQLRKLGIKPGQGGGIGNMLGDLGDGRTLFGIDLDTCRRKSGLIEPWAEEIQDDIQTYREVSPRKGGVKLFGFVRTSEVPALREALGNGGWGAKWTHRAGKHPPGVELYFGGRYFAVTGETDGKYPLAVIEPEKLRALIDAQNARTPAQVGRGESRTAGKRAGPDKSRSGDALSLAGRICREGGSIGDFEEALAEELPAWKEEKGDNNNGRETTRAWAKAERDWKTEQDALADLVGGGPGGLSAALTEDGVALAFAKRFGGVLRFDHHVGKWFRWTGAHWQQEERQLALHWARETGRAMAVANPKEKAAAKALARFASASGVEKLARADPTFSVTSEIWDRDPWLLGTPGGTVDLRTGELREARQEDHISKLAAVTPEADFDADLDCPRWLAFLDQATGGDAEAIRFLAQWFGYTLTGITREHALMFIYGPGGNGKGVLLHTIGHVMGGYCTVTGMEVFADTQFRGHPQELARLKGARMVTAAETEEGRAWAEVRINHLTGGDKITARYMRQNDFEFQPECKITVSGNHKPVLRNVTDAARRRFLIMPFLHKPEVKDLRLEETLRAEWPGILAWLIRGCLDWQRQKGLIRPRVVIQATAEYFATQDTFQQWLDECCEVGLRLADTSAALFESWERFADRHGDAAPVLGRSKGFPDIMAARGFENVRDVPGLKGRGYRGLRLRQPDGE